MNILVLAGLLKILTTDYLVTKLIMIDQRCLSNVGLATMA